MRFAGALLALTLALKASAAPIPTVKFTPTVKIYECPLVFKHKSECVAHEKTLAPVKIWLDIEVLDQAMGHWTHQETAPVPASFHVIVLRGRSGPRIEYSVSTETGLTGSPMPFSNGRVEIAEGSIPKTFGVSGAPAENAGKKYLTELRLSDFHGRVDQ